MTSTTTDLATVPTEILKTDCKGRIRFPAKMREELLDRFERSGMSGAEFAAFYNIKYPTFANWRQKRERDRRREAGEPEPVSFVEVSTLEPERAPLRVTLPGGASVHLSGPEDAGRVAGLLKALEAAGC